jgi:hypothetical protein
LQIAKFPRVMMPYRVFDQKAPNSSNRGSWYALVSMANESKAQSWWTQSWWTTLPGILTGLAAVLTAVSGLMIAFHQVSGRDDAQGTAKKTTSGGQAYVRESGAGSASSSTANASNSVASSAAKVELPLPAIREAKLDGGNTVINILKVELQPFNAEKRALKFTVRHTNNGRYEANFWSNSYRLLVDDIPQAPTNLLDELVPGDSAKVGEVIFEIPLTVEQVVLQISSGNDKTRITVPLTSQVR